jgi:hypothetical protein
MSNNIWPEFVGFSTPIIPEEIRAIRHPAYKNIFEYELGNENLWGTETLFGDWAGHTLIVAKDFYPAELIEQDIQAGVAPRPHIATGPMFAPTSGLSKPSTNSVVCRPPQPISIAVSCTHLRVFFFEQTV